MRKAARLSLAASLLAASTLANTVPAMAQAIVGPDEIIVTGTRFETPLDQVGRTVSVITEEDIEIRQQRFLIETLEDTPGLQVIRSGSDGGLTSVSLRGLSSADTLVVIDGIVQNDPSSFGNTVNFNNIDTADIARIEVLRGAQSTLYGSDAIAGVINIVTKDGRNGRTARALLETGSRETFRGEAGLSGGNDLASGRVTISAFTTEGISSADSDNGNTERDGFDTFTVSAKGRLQASETLGFEGILRFVDSETEFDDLLPPTFALTDDDDSAETQSWSLGGRAYLDLLEGRFENRLSVNYFENDRLNLDGGTPTFDAEGRHVTAEYQGQYAFSERVDVIGGVEYEQQETTSDAGNANVQKIDSASIFGLVQFKPVDGLTLDGGVRFDTSDDYTDETSFSASAAYLFSEQGTILRGSYGEGFRAPTSGQLVFNRTSLDAAGLLDASNAIDPQTSKGWDIGLEQRFWDDRVKLSATYFDQEIDSLIAFDFSIGSNGGFANIQEFTSEGVEVALTVDVSQQIVLSAAYTYTDAQNLSTTFAAGNQPKHRIQANMDVSPDDRFAFGIGVTYNDEERDGSQTLDDFFLTRVRASYDITQKLQMFGRIENVFDADYQDNFGYGTPPTSAFGGVRLTY